jgi:hypothetical protein
MKNEIMPVYSTILVDFYDENPYETKESETGLRLTSGKHESPDSGELEKKDTWYRVGQILEVGPACKYAKAGDDVYLDLRGCRPFPFRGKIYWQAAEQNIIALMADDLTTRKEFEWNNGTGK